MEKNSIGDLSPDKADRPARRPTLRARRHRAALPAPADGASRSHGVHIASWWPEGAVDVGEMFRTHVFYRGRRVCRHRSADALAARWDYGTQRAQAIDVDRSTP
jgi:hypothetical protein